MRIDQSFQQPAPVIPPSWSSNRVLKAILQRTLPEDVYRELNAECQRFEKDLDGPIHEMAMRADGHFAEAELTQYDSWGKRVDEIRTSEGWKELKRLTAQEGMVGDVIEGKQGVWSRTWVFVKWFLLVPEGRCIGCPISMTDGAARILQLYGTEEMKRDVLPRLCSRDPKLAWTAGQWMTERPGGSDVSLTETIATPLAPSSTAPGDLYTLDGFKWFSSATDGDIALALARTGSVEEGSRGLSLFLVKLRKEDGELNGIRVHRLKKKWGTKALPTAELELNGTIAQLIGPLGRGVAIISTVLNITRLHSAIDSIASLTRALAIAKSFALVRHVGGASGGLLSDNAMHTASLMRVELVVRGLTQMVFSVVALMGKSEMGQASEDEARRLRLLTPVVKAFAAEMATGEMLFCMESLGGQGYMMENEIGRLLSDSAVERIWEGTASIMALDVIRVIKSSKGLAIASYVKWALSILSAAPSDLKPSVKVLEHGLNLINRSAQYYLSRPSPSPQLARPLLFLLGYLTSALELVAQASWSTGSERETDMEVVKRWVGGDGMQGCLRDVDVVLGRGREEQREVERVDRGMVYGVQRARL